MGALIGSVLQGLAKLLDKYVPGAGVRHIVLSILAIVGNISFFLTGHITSAEASSNIVMAFGIIFAAAHKTDG